jgi:catechol 2,3-dioxygenase-like lactoylglutathione lyase family enzyme
MLKNSPVTPTIPVTDIKKAKDFYQNKLGLKLDDKQMPDGLLFEAGEETLLYIYERGKSTADHTLASFKVDNIEQEIKELTEKGILFEQYDLPNGLVTDENGIATMGNVKSAWFKDPDDNILALVQIKE